MSKRLAGLGLILGLLLIAGATAASAAEGGGAPAHGPLPGIDEIGSRDEVASEFFPEAYEEPPFFRFFYVPLIIVGVLATAGVLYLYLLWQMRFVEERRAKRRR